MNVLDLFAGLGCFSLGLERAGMRAAAFCENDDHCQRVIRRHWPDVPIYDDIRDLTGEIIRGDRLKIDVITMGFPCQDISSSGPKTGIDGERSGLWREGFRLVCEIRPQFVIVENSSEINVRGLGDLLGALASIRYDAEWARISLLSIGAPHNRDRTYLVAYPAGERQQEQGRYLKSLHSAPDAYREADRLVDAVQGKSLPFVCRGHDGAPEELERRLRAIGNSNGPQIPEMIGRAIMEAAA